jgi:hypothetical protein
MKGSIERITNNHEINNMNKLVLVNCLLLLTAVEVSARNISPDALHDTHPLPYGCTVITVSKVDSIFFGGNDDYINPDSYYWVEQGDSAKYGVIWIGTPDNPQQGVNEKRLAYDSNGLPRFDVNPHAERLPVAGEYHNYVMQIMHECATVEEVINWVNTHQRYPYMHDQLHFADPTGDAVIVSAGRDGEMVFTRKEPGDGFLISSNFNIANPSNGFGYPCWRYDLAQKLLGQLIEKEEPLRHTDVTNVMDSVHQEGASWTIETMVADLVNGIMYIYFFYQYDRPFVINVKNELVSPHKPGPLSKLFPVDVQEEAARRYNKNQAVMRINKIVGIAWPSIVFVSLILLFIITADYKKGLRFWLPAVLVLGPVALIIKLVTDNWCKTTCCHNAIIETLGDVIPVVISYTAALVILILSMLSESIPWQNQVTLMFGLPVIAGLVFHMAFLSPLRHKDLGRFFIQRLAQVLITTFIASGGIIPVAMLLINKSLNMSLLIPLSPLVVMTWWAIVVLGSLLGGLLVFLFERWAVKRGFRAWTILAGADGEVMTTGWGKNWWWLLISVVILLAGLVTGVTLVK